MQQNHSLVNGQRCNTIKRYAATMTRESLADTTGSTMSHGAHLLPD